MRLPILIKMRSWIYPVIDYQKIYGNDDLIINHAKGEIEKKNFLNKEELDKYKIGKRLLASGTDEKGDFDLIWIYLGDNWVKVISKMY